MSLDGETTRALTRRATGGVSLDEVLLAALVRAWGRLTGEASLRLDLEAHGRDVGDGEALFDDVDLSRTVGWLTSLYPVVLRLAETPSAGEPAGDTPSARDLQAIRRQLRAVPRRGVGWGAMRWLGEGSGVPLPAPAQVVFNYLGDLDQALSADAPLAPAAEELGAFHDPLGERPHPLAVEASLFEGRLRVTLVHAPGRHRRDTIEGLATALRGALEEFARQDGLSPGEPSDEPDPLGDDLADDELSTILSQLEDARSIEEPWT